jgi:phage tail-like protein
VTEPTTPGSSPGSAPGTSQALLALEHCFQATVNGTLLGTFLEVSGLAAQYETYEYAEGGNNLYMHQFVGRLKWPNLTLKSGVTNQTVLLDWVLGNGDLTGPQTLVVQFLGADGSSLRSFSFAHALPIRWTGPNANIGASAVATESLEIAHHGLAPVQ